MALVAFVDRAGLVAFVPFVAVLGVCAGSVYVLGFTLIHESVDDELRGRIFSALYTLVRFCVLIAFAAGPFLSESLSRLSRRLFDGEISFGDSVTIAVPGVRLTLWLAGLIIIGAGVIAVRSISPRGGRASLKNLREDIVSGFTTPITEVKRSHDDPTARGRGDDPPAPAAATPAPTATKATTGTKATKPARSTKATKATKATRATKAKGP